MVSNSNSGDYLSLGQACNLLGLSPPTARRLLDQNESLGVRLPSGHRRFSRVALRQYLGLTRGPQNGSSKRVVCVIRVSTGQQKTSLEHQEQQCLAYCKEHLPGLPLEVNKSIRSGMAVGHPAFVRLIVGMVSGEYSDLVTTYSERICRSSLPLIRALCEKYSITLHIINRMDDKEADDFASDILAYTMYYNAKYNAAKSARLSRIEVSPENVRIIVQKYTEGYSHEQIRDYCKEHNITGIKGEMLKHGRIGSIISKNSRLYSELKLINGESPSFDQFVEQHLIKTDNMEKYVIRTEMIKRYRKWCAENGKAKLVSMRIARKTKEWGWVERHAKNGSMIFRGVEWKNA